VEIPAEWKNIDLKPEAKRDDVPDFIRDMVFPINSLKGDDLPVSAFLDREDGTFPAGTTAYEKRGIAVHVPEWQLDNCIQCNQCAYVCPHAVIRPFLIDDEEMKTIGEDTPVIEITKGKLAGFKYRMQVSPLDCTGCGNCAEVCPAPQKALIMKSLDSQMHEDKRWDVISTRM
jgi:pyruvate-ferredoxin/flavodoxin oxidoreductase